jgi:hypothetical protein
MAKAKGALDLIRAELAAGAFRNLRGETSELFQGREGHRVGARGTNYRVRSFAFLDDAYILLNN